MFYEYRKDEDYDIVIFKAVLNLKIMKKLLLLLLTFGFIVSSYADSDSCINAYDNDVYENIVIECTTPANAGDMVSQNILGWAYLAGQGVTQDYSIAFSWISKSAEQGNTWALGQLGLMYQNGYGVSKDYNQAFTLLTSAYVITFGKNILRRAPTLDHYDAGLKWCLSAGRAHRRRAIGHV